jgi:uncharacterized protein
MTAKGNNCGRQAGCALAEQVICANEDLGALDQKMAQLYFRIANDSTGRYYRRLKLDQRLWLTERNGCGANVRCLRSTYRARIEEFQQALHAGDRAL